MKHSATLDYVDEPANGKVVKFLINRQDSKIPNNATVDLKSFSEQLFTIFSKGKDYKFLPWDSMIPQFYNSNFFVETWTKPDKLESICGEHEVNNILSLKFGNYEYTCNNEHSKWSVSENVVCIGDLNRTGTQLKRGGLVICIVNNAISKIFMESIAKA